MAVAACLLAIPAVALAATDHGFPGKDPNESVRIHTPNDPTFDCAEPDDQDGGSCSNVFSEEYPRFGFAPSATQDTATYHAPSTSDPHIQRLMAQNTNIAPPYTRNAAGQVPGVSADRAWKYTPGDPKVRVAILDTGIRWENTSLRTRIALNRKELPLPHNGSKECSKYDCNGDGAFNVDDYAKDPRVDKTAGEDTADTILDGSDLIAAFSNGKDNDRNGYVDDIAGWDFFDDDNNPFDASSYSSANNHGSGRASDAAEEGNDANGSIGVCPRCQIVPLRVWDTFVVDTDNFGLGVTYAADNGIDVVEGAVGGLFNSRFARQAFDYAYRKGTFLAIVSSDLNTADHNFPTYYDEAMQVQGTVADVQGLGQDCPSGITLPIGCNAPVQTWFRNSGTTQYGGHAHIVMPAVTGSVATGQASGAAGLLISYAREKHRRLAPNEVKQLLTLTAQDVVPENTGNDGTDGIPDPAQKGWDQHFGYGLPDLGLAMERIQRKQIPPQALITGPPWFAPLNVDQQSKVDITGRVSARFSHGYSYQLQWAPGIEPAESEFRDVGSPENAKKGFDGKLGKIDLGEVRNALDNRTTPCPTNIPPSPPVVTGGSACDPTAPRQGPGDRDPNEPAFTVRVVVTDKDGNRGEDRKTLFAYRDDSLLKGWSKYIGSGGEASMRLFNLDAENHLEAVLADSSGTLRVLEANASPEDSFNKGRSVSTQPNANVHYKAPVFKKLDPPREVLRTPAIGDIDGDMEPEIVDSAGEHVYAWHQDGRRVKGFPVRLDPKFSKPQDRTKRNHVKRGFSASPTLSDLNGDGKLDITIPGLDQHLYAWDGRGKPLPGFPVKLQEPGTDTSKVPGAESINTAAVGDIDGDGKPDIVAPTNEVDGSSQPADPSAGFGGIVTGAAGASGRLYAVDRKGKFLNRWPTHPSGILPDALPFVGPGVDHVLGDVNGDGKLDVIGNLTSGQVQATKGDASNAQNYDETPPAGENVADRSLIVNLFENPIVANFDGLPGLEVIKGGVTTNQLVNLGVAVGQNLPFYHVIQAWNAATGQELPNFPQAVEDYQLLSSPSVGDVSNAPGKELLLGTGLYLIRAINAQGQESSDFPKFTGGWNFAVPSIGDFNDDGKLDFVSLTREGNVFAWKTDRPACGGNDEWWTSRHDEWSTGAYGTDTRPPGAPEHLKVNRSGDKVTFSWRAPGGDFMCGKAKRFRVLVSNHSIDHPDQGKPVGGDTDSAASPGDKQTITFTAPRNARFVAVLYQDEAGNWGHLDQAKL